MEITANSWSHQRYYRTGYEASINWVVDAHYRILRHLTFKFRARYVHYILRFLDIRQTV